MLPRTTLLAIPFALAIAGQGAAQDAWEKARVAALADLARFREDAGRELAAREARLAELRRELIDASGRASEAEREALAIATRIEDATRGRDAAQAELVGIEAEVEGVRQALAERGSPTSGAATESRPGPEWFDAALRDVQARLDDAGRIRADGALVRIGDLQWIEVLPGDRAVVGRPGRASPVGPIEIPGIATLLDALSAGTPPPFIVVDPTGRLELRPPAAAPRDLAGYVRAGGPIVIVIAVLGVLGLLLAIARLGSLVFEATPGAADVARAREFVLRGDRPGAAALLRSRRGSIQEALAEVALVDGAAGDESREGRIEQILLRTVGRFERFLQLVAVLAGVLPLLGLLGTVVGMIRMFDALSGGTTGASHVEALSGGIGEALITTEAGLVFAIPLMLLHALISARADRLEGALEAAAIEVAGGGSPGERPR